MAVSPPSATGEPLVSRYRLRVLGGLSLERDGRPVEEFVAQRRALALLAVLTCAGSRGVSRDRLMLLLWPESDTERARGSLKQLLYAMRKQLGDPPAVTGTVELQLNDDAVESDVADFRAALASGNDSAAVTAYGGPFLDGVHIDGADELERWAAEERGGLERAYAEALERLALQAEDDGRHDQSIAHWRRLLQLDPLNGRVVTGLMRALDASGDRAGALQQARSHEGLLQRELGAPPDPDVARLADAMQSGAYVRQTLRPQSHAPRSPAGAVPPSADDEVRADRVPRSRGVLWAAVISLVAFAAAGGLAWQQRAAALNEALLPNRVAVALFVNRTGMPALDHLGTMTSDWVTQGLARTSLVDVFDIGGLYVQGRTPRGEPADPRALARANGAGLAVAGNYYLGAHDSLTFSAQVIDVASGKVLRTIDPIAGTVSEPLGAVDEVRQRVTVALRTVLEPRGAVWATPAMAPPRLDAYTEFATGQELYWNGDWVGALPHIRRAAELDTNFHTALAYLAVVGVGTARCDIADSVHTVLLSRGDRVPELDLLPAKLALARCASDHEEHNRLHRQRAALVPGSKFTQMVMSTGFRQLNRPAEALAVLDNIDPARDLGWLPERGRAFYWREIAANRHALGEYDAELATADRMRAARASPLGIGYFRARAFAGLGKAREALAAAAAISTAANEPALVSGIVGPLNAAHLASPGWVFYQTALELDAHGDSISARVAAERALAWFDTHAASEPSPPSERFVHASVLELLGDLAKARSMLDALVASDSARVDYRGAAGVVAARQGDTTAAGAIAAWLAARPVQFPPGLPVLYRAKIAAVSGDPARALELIGQLPHGAHPLDFPQFHIDPAFRSLRSNAVFMRMLVPRG